MRERDYFDYTKLKFILERKKKQKNIFKVIARRLPLWMQYPLGIFCIKLVDPLKNGYMRYKRYGRFLEESQWWPRQKLEEYQTKRLKFLLEHVYKNVPYYRDIFKKASFTPDDFHSIKDLKKLPILSKEDVINNFDKLIAENIPFKKQKRRFDLRSTSGSTGKPMFFYRDREYHFQRIALSFWNLKQTNFKVGDKYIQLWSRPFIEKNINDIKLYQPYERKLSLSSIPCPIDRLEEYFQQIKNFRPKFISGSPSFLYALACYARDHSYADVRFPVFFSSYENIYPFQRELIENQFRCEIFNWYGSEEFYSIATECDRHEGMHVDIRKGIMEIVDEQGHVKNAGAHGKIVYTGFDNFIMPLIRYDMGDIGSISERHCSCGRGLPLLESLEGRTSEALIYKNKYIYPSVLSVILEKFTNIKECQFIQEPTDRLTLNIVRRETYTSKDTEMLKTGVRKLIDDDLMIKICFVDFIPRTNMGKFQLVIK